MFDMLTSLLINAFIVLYLIHAWCWDLPESQPEYQLADKFKRIILWLGLHHSWKMFAPHPMRLDRYVQARIRFVDGTIGVWNEPALSKMSFFKAFLYGKHLSWKNSLAKDDNKHVRAGYAQYLARHPQFADKQIESMTFFLIKQFVQSPSEPEEKSAKIERIKLFDYTFSTPRDKEKLVANF